MSVDTAGVTAPLELHSFTDAEQVLAQRLPGYQSRVGQQMLARAIEEIMAKEAADEEASRADGDLNEVRYPNHLLGQAPTGSGKSLAYLVPMIISGKRVAVSVTTKALQGQLVRKDVPFLEENLGIDFTWAMLQGRSNYVCFNACDTISDPSSVTTLAQIRRLAENPDFSGLREELGFDVPDVEWAQMRADSETCQSLHCSKDPEGEERCYATKARRVASRAKLVIVNHSIVCTDLMLASLGIPGMLSGREMIVFDEAHDLEEVAANTLGYRLMRGTFTTLASDVRSFVLSIADEDSGSGIEARTARVLAAADALYDDLAGMWEIERNNETNVRIDEKKIIAFSDQFLQLIDMLVELHTFWESIDFHFEDSRERTRWSKITSRLQNAISRTREVVVAKQIDLVRWVEVTKSRRDEQVLIINAAPVSVAEFLNTWLWSKTPTISVSATMTVNNSFRFLADNLGIDSGKTVNVDSPFDFAAQGLFYVPRTMPIPKGDGIAAFEAQSTEEIIKLARASQGRALVLFTSRKRMLQVAAEIRDRKAADERREDMGMTLADEDRVGFPYRLLVQGDMQNRELVQAFRGDTHSVLFGLKSFMTGVDFQGETLSLLVIDKLPFPVPSDPIAAAKMERIEAQGGNTFAGYMIPVMSLILQQAVGRLIRSVTDTGVVVMLDRRIADVSYGKKIMRDLPNLPLSRDFDDVTGFYASH